VSGSQRARQDGLQGQRNIDCLARAFGVTDHVTLSAVQLNQGIQQRQAAAAFVTAAGMP
jgi:hypothetical protein